MLLAEVFERIDFWGFRLFCVGSVFGLFNGRA